MMGPINNAGLELDLRVAFDFSRILEIHQGVEQIKENIAKAYVEFQRKEYVRVMECVNKMSESEKKEMEESYSIYSRVDPFRNNKDYSWKGKNREENLLYLVARAAESRQGAMKEIVLKRLIEQEGEESAQRIIENRTSFESLKIWDFYKIIGDFLEKEELMRMTKRVSFDPQIDPQNNSDFDLHHHAVDELVSYVVDRAFEKRINPAYFQEQMIKDFCERFEDKYIGMPYHLEFKVFNKLRTIGYNLGGAYPSVNDDSRILPAYVIDKCVVSYRHSDFEKSRINKALSDTANQSKSDQTDWRKYHHNEFSRIGHRKLSCSPFEIEEKVLGMLSVGTKQNSIFVDENVLMSWFEDEEEEYVDEENLEF